MAVKTAKSIKKHKKRGFEKMNEEKIINFLNEIMGSKEGLRELRKQYDELYEEILYAQETYNNGGDSEYVYRMDNAEQIPIVFLKIVFDNKDFRLGLISLYSDKFFQQTPYSDFCDDFVCVGSIPLPLAHINYNRSMHEFYYNDILYAIQELILRILRTDTTLDGGY